MYDPSLVSHLEADGEIGRRGLLMSARTLLADALVHLKSALKLICAVQVMDLTSLRLMVQLEAVPNLEV